MTAEELDARRADISPIFYYLESHTSVASGRTVGRKIGVIQEVLLHRYLRQSEVLARGLWLKQSIAGHSGADHKIEFSWHPYSTHEVVPGEEIPGTGGLLLSGISAKGLPRLKTPAGMGNKQALQAHQASQSIGVRAFEVNDDMVVFDVCDRTRLLAVLESKRVGAQRFAGSDKLGSGIQTIEKAKQAALVAIDVDRKHNGPRDPAERVDPGEKQCLTVVALGNGVHWTDKDKMILGTYVDYTYTVRDSAIIRYLEHVAGSCPEGTLMLKHIMSYFQGMTKQPEDAFAATHEDFVVTAPIEEKRTLIAVLDEHVSKVNKGQF